jgi:restriction system protein
MWLGAILIALFAIAVIAALKNFGIQKPPSAAPLPKTEQSLKKASFEIDTPKPVKVEPTEKSASQPEAKRAPRYFGAEERDAKKIPEVEAKIRAEIERRQSIQESQPFLAVCSVLDLDPYSETLAHEFISEVYTRLRLQGQLVGQGPHRIPESLPVKNMLKHVLEAAYGMLLHADENFEVVRSYLPMLLSKRRSLTDRDQYWDENLKPWIDFSSRFAVDKLKGISTLKFFMENLASNSARSTVSHQGLADMFGSFARMAIVILEFSSDKATTEAMGGVEYERLLQMQIEKAFPTAHVSTTVATGDQGSDLIVDVHGKRIAIQAKYYQSAVGNAAVQEAFSGKGFYQADFAMVVCNSSFTRHAKELSEKLEIVLATTDDYIQIIATLVDRP